jgi:hypothetical protein
MAEYTREESLERLYWSLQVDIEFLMSADIALAYKLLNWADEQLEKASEQS